MSNRGKIEPELAALLREIAGRIDRGEATTSDAARLERLASQAAGEDRDYSVKVHRTRGQQSKGSLGVDQRLELARLVKAHRAENGGTLGEAYEALNGTFHAGPETIKKAWQKMGPLLDLDQKSRDAILYFQRLESRGLSVKVRRVKR